MDANDRAYDLTAKVLHWLIAALVLTQFVIAYLMPDIGPNTVPDTLINLHLSFGIVILALTAVRLVYRWLHPVALDAGGSPLWERRAAYVTHVVFYLVLLIGPFLGWASASAHRIHVVVFGVVALPDIAAPRARWALTAGDVHTVLMWGLLALIGLHVAVALYHHFIRHDGTLRRMLPGRGARLA